MENLPFFFYVFLIVSLFLFLNATDNDDRFIHISREMEPCVCVPFYQCSNDVSGELVTDGRFLLDQRIIDTKSEINKCPGHFDVCCKIKNARIQTTKARPRKNPSEFTNSKGCGYEEDDIVSWAATIIFQRPDKISPPSYKCGASIIHRDAVLTAAHCMEEEGYYYIKTGEATRKMYSVVIHPEFEMGSLRHDIAIIILRKTDDRSHQPLYPCISHKLNIPNNTRCIAATFNAATNSLEKIHMPYVDPVTCTERLKTTRLGKHFDLHESFICAGGSEKDTCIGDGGNPLICPILGQPGRYSQVGIVSWGIGCGKRGIPGVYVNVTHVRDWIDGVMKEFGKDVFGYAE